MATEMNGSIKRHRSARTADHAATAALYATRPERKPSVVDPTVTEYQLIRDTKATGSGAVPNHASAGAGAAAAHARSRQVKHGKGKEVAKRPTSLTRDYHDLDATQRGQYSLEGFKAASTAVRDSRATPTLPPTGITCDIPEKGPAEEAHQTVGHERAIRAASGAFASSRKRSDSAPTKPPDGFATWADACRLHHAANENARLYTSETGPVLEEQDRKGVERAAAASMTRDLDEAPMRKENPLSVSGARTSLGRSRSQRPTTKSDPAALQRAILLQYAAQNRAAERIAEMQDGLETYQMYYGTAVPSTRSRLSVRRRRTPSVGDSSMVDVERSMEIRNQMSTLQTKLDEVDEQRQKDRDNLMEAARRNVDAAIHDMELRVLADTGRAPASMQKELEEAALERAEREIEEPVDYGDLVNIGAGQFVDPAEVEEAARSRVKPTLEEMDDRVEEQRARELEERLDREEKRRVAALASEREAEIRAEEREHKGRSRIWPSFRSNKRAEEQRARKAESRMDKAEEKRRHSIERQRAADIRSEEQQSIAQQSVEERRRRSRESMLAEEREPPVQETSADIVGRAQAGAAEEAPLQPSQEPVPVEGREPPVQETSADIVRRSQAGASEEAPLRPSQEFKPAEERKAPAQETSADIVRRSQAGASEEAPLRPSQGFKPAEGKKAAAQETSADIVGRSQAGAAEEAPLEPSRELKPAEERKAPAQEPSADIVGRAQAGASEETSLPEMMRSQTAQEDKAAAATGAPAEPAPPKKRIKTESKLRSWFKDRLKRRPESAREPVREPAREPARVPPKETVERKTSTRSAGRAATAASDDSRGAALSSHPVTGNDLAHMQNGDADFGPTNTAEDLKPISEQNGGSHRSRFRDSLMRIVSRNSQGPKSNGVSTHDQEGTSVKSVETAHSHHDPEGHHHHERGDLRESAAEHGLPSPPGIGEHGSHSTARESRFSEDL